MASAKKRAAQRRHREEKKLARLDYNEGTRELRIEVFYRAGGRCEAVKDAYVVAGIYTVIRCNKPAARMDHFLGRGRFPQSLSNCWALCVECDDAKTLSKPSAEWWWTSFGRHAHRHCYLSEEAVVRERLDGILKIRRVSQHPLAPGTPSPARNPSGSPT